MEEMNLMENTNQTMEVPVTTGDTAEVSNAGGSVLGAVIGAAGVIGLWELTKFGAKKAYHGVKKLFGKKKKQDVPSEEPECECEEGSND